MNIITCPFCKVRIIPKANGTCPNCHLLISKQKRPASSKTVAKGRTTTKDLSSEQDDYDTTTVENKIDWKSINWMRVYADNRFRTHSNWLVIDNWFMIAISLIGFSVFSLITNQPITVSLGGVPVITTNQYLPNILLVLGIAVVIYRLRLLAGDRLVFNGRITKKEVIKNAKNGAKYKFLVNVDKKFTLNAKGELEPSDNLEELNRDLVVDSSLYGLYSKGDKITWLSLLNGEFICDLQKYF